MIRAAITTLRGWAAAVRDWQQDALADMQAMDDATRQHMAHGAMAGQDPLTDSLLQQLDCAAVEGAQPATPYPAGQKPKPEHRGWWITGVTLLAALVSLALFTPGASA